jgi:hypothetical protein
VDPERERLAFDRHGPLELQAAVVRWLEDASQLEVVPIHP